MLVIFLELHFKEDVDKLKFIQGSGSWIVKGVENNNKGA